MDEFRMHSELEFEIRIACVDRRASKDSTKTLHYCP